LGIFSLISIGARGKEITKISPVFICYKISAIFPALIADIGIVLAAQFADMLIGGTCATFLKP